MLCFCGQFDQRYKRVQWLAISQCLDAAGNTNPNATRVCPPPKVLHFPSPRLAVEEVLNAHAASRDAQLTTYLQQPQEKMAILATFVSVMLYKQCSFCVVCVCVFVFVCLLCCIGVCVVLYSCECCIGVRVCLCVCVSVFVCISVKRVSFVCVIVFALG